MEQKLINIIIFLLIIIIAIFLIVYNIRNNNKEAKPNNDNKENKNEIVFSSKNFFEIGFAFCLGAIIAEIVFLMIAFLIYVPIYILLK